VLSYLQNDKTKDIFCLYLAQVYLPVDATKNVNRIKFSPKADKIVGLLNSDAV
jgi:hypothetical protein